MSNNFSEGAMGAACHAGDVLERQVLGVGATATKPKTVFDEATTRVQSIQAHVSTLEAQFRSRMDTLIGTGECKERMAVDTHEPRQVPALPRLFDALDSLQAEVSGLAEELDRFTMVSGG